MSRRNAIVMVVMLILFVLGVGQAQESQIPPMPQLTTNDLWISLGQCKVNGETQLNYINQLRAEVMRLQGEVAKLKETKPLPEKAPVITPTTSSISGPKH